MQKENLDSPITFDEYMDKSSMESTELSPLLTSQDDIKMNGKSSIMNVKDKIMTKTSVMAV